MDIYYSIDDYASQGLRSRVALGFFDGVHAGHRAVIDACCADKGGDTAVVLTFRESPAAALGQAVPPALTDNARKAELLEAAGADAVIFADFPTLRDMSAGGFVRLILRDKLRATAVFCGYNYRFGRRGEGGVDALKSLCAAEGIAATAVEPVYVGGEAVSSTRIRELLTEGCAEQAARMLGCPYALSGAIAGGNRIGTALGYPTVNIPIEEALCVPRRGVYASRVTVDGRTYPGATNIGVHPTVGSSAAPLCETFLLGYDGGELYGKYAVCELLSFIRPEKKFASPEELRRQVEEDVRLVNGER